MTLGMSRPWKHPKTGVYWLRKRVPDDLRAAVGKREEKRSLGTKDPDVAKARLLPALASLEAQWRHLRLGKIELTESQAHQLTRSVYDRWMTIWKDKPSEQKSWNTELGVAALWDLRPISDDKIHLWRWYEDRLSLQEKAFETADELLAKAGLTVDEPSRKRVAVAVTAALQRASLELEQLALGNFSASPDAFSVAGTHARLARARTSLSFQEVVDGWSAEKRPTARTVYEWGLVVSQLKSFLRHDDATAVSTADLNRWKTSLIESGLQLKTVRDAKLAPIRAIFQWAVDNEKLPDNPASRIVLDVKRRPGEGKRSYSDQEAARILCAARLETNPVLRWVPWLCAYTGARVAEICQLRKEDVHRAEGVWCLRITPEAGPLKTISSERIVPVHSVLIAEGFLDFVQAAAPGPLFAALKPNTYGSRGGNGTKMVGRWIRGLGIVDPRISPNHSWRHRFKTLSRRHALSSDIVDALVGHRRRSVADGYGEFPIEALSRELEKIQKLAVSSVGA